MSGISFCVSIKNRLWQIEQTLAENIAALGSSDEICIADFGSDDGFLEWIWAHHAKQIDEGKLRLFEARNEIFWSSPIAKNLAHRMGTQDFLVNLDADNFITPKDVQSFKDCSTAGQPFQQWSGQYPDGSYGRIGLPRTTFLALRGYDDALLPMGGQDANLLNRLNQFGTPVKVIGAPEKLAIPNPRANKTDQIKAERKSVVHHGAIRGVTKLERLARRFGLSTSISRYEEFTKMNALNREISDARIHFYGTKRP
ncbi:MAG: glycosyltransferase, partial [Pseudomonadota bacterium]